MFGTRHQASDASASPSTLAKTGRRRIFRRAALEDQSNCERAGLTGGGDPGDDGDQTDAPLMPCRGQDIGKKDGVPAVSSMISPWTNGAQERGARLARPSLREGLWVRPLLRRLRKPHVKMHFKADWA